MQRLELREDVVIDQAKSAARDPRNQATQTIVGDLARRIGALEAAPAAARTGRSNPSAIA